MYEFHKKNFSFNFEGEPNQKFLLNKNIYKKLEDEKITRIKKILLKILQVQHKNI